MIDLTFITGNANKASQLAQWLNYPIKHLKLDLDEIQTTNITELVTHKARQAFEKLHKPVLIEDSGLIFHAMGNLPGPFIKFFEKELGLEKCCRLLDTYSDRTATATSTFGLCMSDDVVEIFSGETHGHITDHPRGNEGFGWDPIFMADETNKTFAELTLDEIKPYNHRSKAIQKLSEFLKL